MKYKVGDTVRIRKDLKVGRKYGLFTLTENMYKFSGVETVIYGLIKTIPFRGKQRNTYHLRIDGGENIWSSEMFEKPKPKVSRKKVENIIMKELSRYTIICTSDVDRAVNAIMKLIEREDI